MTDAPLTIPKLRVPEYPEVEDRKHLSAKQKAELVLKQGGRCAGCGIKPRHGWEFDHGKALWKGDTNQSDIREWQAFGSRKDCKCHATKTAKEAAERAKMRRLRGLAGQQKRRRERGGSSITGRAEIQSRPFPKSKGKTQWPKRKFETRKS